MGLFFKKLSFLNNRALICLLKESYSSPSAFVKVLVCIWKSSQKLIYFKIERRLKNVPWMKKIRFAGDEKVIGLASECSASILDWKVWDGLPKHERETVRIGSAPERVRLASESVLFSPELFFKRFEDPEDTFSIHRFQWLLILLQKQFTSGAIDFGYEAIECWIRDMKSPSDPYAFEPYSVSERLVNWIFFVLLTKSHCNKGDIFWEELSRSYEYQLQHLIASLEYHWIYTNNHILNNARCLYICGSLLGIEDAKNLGKQIIFYQADKMICNGIIQEASSHYQMILARSFLEIFYVAQICKDRKMQDWLEARVVKMLQICDKLQSRFSSREYPLFGDICPDVFPGWFLGWPFSQKNGMQSKWQDVFRIDRNLISIPEMRAQPADTKVGSLGWYYIAGGKFEVWIITKRKGNLVHGHPDNGSVVVFYNGIPVLVDPGLFRYSGNSYSFLHGSCEAHHLPMIDRRVMGPDKRPIIDWGSVSSTCEVLRMGVNYLHYKVISFDNKVILERKVSIRQNHFVDIEDVVLKAAGKKKIRYSHNWCSNILPELKGDEAELEVEGAVLSFGVKANRSLVLSISQMQRSSKYGELQKAYQIRASTNTTVYNKIISTLQEISPGA